MIKTSSHRLNDVVPLRGHLPPAPRFMVQLAVSRIVKAAAMQFPAFFDRLGRFHDVAYLIDPVDLSFMVILKLQQGNPTAQVLRRRVNIPQPHYDACVAASLTDLLGLLNGTLDSDALFFARRLLIEGDTTAVVTLRNALDNMDSDILAASLAGLPRYIRRPATLVLAHFSRKIGQHAA